MKKEWQTADDEQKRQERAEKATDNVVELLAKGEIAWCYCGTCNQNQLNSIKFGTCDACGSRNLILFADDTTFHNLTDSIASTCRDKKVKACLMILDTGDSVVVCTNGRTHQLVGAIEAYKIHIVNQAFQHGWDDAGK